MKWLISKFPLLPSNNLPTVKPETAIPEAINALLLIAGILAVIFIAVGGFMYVLSQGDPGRTKQARETFMYAMVGLAITILAFAAVQLVVTYVTKGP